ncbi:HEAT repeat domain-containing protein [Synechococcus sp. M16CYN]|uniref:HEAT repeat domain-containing protein n=1 Tax=Synechococcus sp. M16CYN TaxID=3103139 RepID=UPI00324DE775
MKQFNNIHPELTCERAYNILSTPLDKIVSQSDFYMAAAHLINCHGAKTEYALLNLLEKSSNNQAVKIAKRKAVEVLARLGYISAISAIGKCLWSEDIYLVENSVWALQQLQCNDSKLIDRMLYLLKDENQNQRVLIQCLAGLRVQSSLKLIQTFQCSKTPNIRSAAISAVAQLTNNISDVPKIIQYLTFPNQMDRQCAVQDLIDANASEFLPAIVAAPISPSFRMRACRQFFNKLGVESINNTILSSIDSILKDDPNTINIIHTYKDKPSVRFLINNLYNTDFSRCYLALINLNRYPTNVLWPLLKESWEQKANNDYGAHYFFMHVLGSCCNWPLTGQEFILQILQESVVNRRPQFRKSRSAAIQSLQYLYPKQFLDFIFDFLSKAINLPWDCRYVIIMCIEKFSYIDYHTKKQVLKLLLKDPDTFVRARAAKSFSELL